MQEKIIEVKTCKHCNSSFEITDKDLEFYEKISPCFASPSIEGDGGGVKKYLIPSPTLCPDCRQQRRLSFRNERKIYKRNCDASGKPIISIYSPDKPYKVYEQSFWWSDKWNPMIFGKNFDFSKSFFEQFNELMREIPVVNIMNRNSENSEYTNICAFNKNCYMLVESSNNENCLNSYWLQNSTNCVDSSFLNNCQNCYQTIDSTNCNKLFFSQNCLNSTNSYLLKNCTLCNYCIGCEGLKNKEYFVLNKFVGKKTYENILKDLNKNIKDIFKDFLNLKNKLAKKYAEIENSENCIGDYILSSKNCINCFEINDVKDCKNSVHVLINSSDCYDVDTVGLNSNLIYESINTAIDCQKNIFCVRCWSCNNLAYCNNCDYSSNLFGCIGLRNKSYCILNKQYSKEEYESLVPKIIEHMQKTGEWGEFFPSSISPFGYNETVAEEYFPLSKNEALEKGFNWSDYESPFPKVDKIIKASLLPDNISDIPDDILNWAIECEVSGKPFRIVRAELEFYKKHSLPIPKRHPDQRHLDRLGLRNPRKLFDRICDKCGKSIKTTYSPGGKEIVYCESCYEKVVY